MLANDVDFLSTILAAALKEVLGEERFSYHSVRDRSTTGDLFSLVRRMVIFESSEEMVVSFSVGDPSLTIHFSGYLRVNFS